MMKLIVGGPAAESRVSRPVLLLVLVLLNTAVVSVAILQCSRLFRGSAHKPWKAPHPATAREPLTVGSPAPDFTLPHARERRLVRLADLRRGKPVVLILSSFTCDYFAYHQGFLKDLFREYQDRAEFLTVVIREAKHPISGMEFLLDRPVDTDHRRRLVAQAMDLRMWPLPTAVDTDDASVEHALKAFPLRLVVVSPTGQIDFATTFAPSVFGLDRHQITQWFEKRLGAAQPRANLLRSEPICTLGPAG
jgi:hypothetical protein